MNAALAMFAIEAGVKLGRKIHDVLIDANIQRPLVLPVGDLFADDKILSVAHAYQSATDWHQRHPDLG